MQTLAVKVQLLKSEHNSFEGKDGKQVEYRVATILDKDGDIMKLPVTAAVHDTIKDLKNSTGTAVINIVAGFKEKPKVNLVEFRPAK